MEVTVHSNVLYSVSMYNSAGPSEAKGYTLIHPAGIAGCTLHQLRPPQATGHFRGCEPVSRPPPLLHTGKGQSVAQWSTVSGSNPEQQSIFQVNDLHTDPAILAVPGLADRGYIFIDGR